MIEYYKLIALLIDDFCSSIFFECNYDLSDIEEVNNVKKDLESKGYICFIIKVNTYIRV
ncbi:MAG: hypothetical protein K2G70_03625 [Turicibacter sp.]|nr:hypothetical protein [Turicibacter sp.]